MLMGGIQRNDVPRWRSQAVNPPPCPDDFEATLIRIGREACKEHYRVGRLVVDHWLLLCGKDRLIAARAAFVAQRKAEVREKLSRSGIRTILADLFPADERQVSYTLARHAAAHLRIRRNGGWIVSPAGDGLWWLGTRRVTAAQLVDAAKAAGFSPSLTDDDGGEVG